jgi:hypothetical protein
MKKTSYAYPFQNTSIEDLPSEKWAALPGFEGEYEISSLGRIKSLSRWRANGDNSGYYTKEIIRKQHARFKKNELLNQRTYTVGSTLKKNGKSYSTSTSRYVYHAFVKPFDLDDKQLMISYKDYDGRNLHYDNLILTNFSEIHKRSFKLNRHHSRFIDERLPIRQVSMDGKMIQQFPSLTEAEKKTGIHISGISACLKGHIYQFQGFRWELQSAKPAPPIKKPEAKELFNEYLWKRIGKPRTSKKNPIPVLHIGATDLEGEKWKAMDGLETSYQISSFGRLKALPRFKHGGISQIWTKGKILKLVPDGKANRKTSCLLVPLTKSGKKFQLAAGRLVYHHFVKKIDLTNKKIRMGYKNGKYYDLNAKNLFVH